jgi:hypothetical protein
MNAKQPRYVVTVEHRKPFSFARVIDTKTGRCMGAADSFRDGEKYRELCDIQARALNNPWKEKA